MTMISSPYDRDVRLSKKRDTVWKGYKVHLTETCDDDSPHVITHVETTSATTQDNVMVTPIHEALADKEMLPQEHLADGGYVDTPNLQSSEKTYGVTLIGPVPPDPQWQARRSDALRVSDFEIDWAAQQVTCPQGHISQKWVPYTRNHDRAEIRVTFRPADCQPCPVRASCTRSALHRQLTLRPQAEHTRLAQARRDQATPQFRQRYAPRMGVEGTLSQAIRLGGLRKGRYWGGEKTQMQHVFAATALNIVRGVAWVQERPRGSTRVSRFARLQPKHVTFTPN